MNKPASSLTEQDFVRLPADRSMADAIVRPSVSYWRDVLRRIRSDKVAIVSLTFLVIIILMAIFAPILSPYGYETTDLLHTNQPPSAEHWFGTDAGGRDLWTRVWVGARISLIIGLGGAIVPQIIGIFLGGLSGFFGGWVDMLIMRIVDIFNCIPTLPIMLIISYMLDANGVADMPKLYIMMAMLTLIGWAGVARMVRGQILYLREQEYMMAAECTGISVWRKLFKHLLPNVLPQLIVSMTLGLGGIILTEATLGFLGLGVPADFATWGNMINVLTSEVSYWGAYPNQWVPVGICIVLAVLAFNFVGDGLRDAFDPKMKR